jgi:hypothetical protein
MDNVHTEFRSDSSVKLKSLYLGKESGSLIGKFVMALTKLAALLILAGVNQQPAGQGPRPAAVRYWDRLRVDYGRPAAQFEAVDVAGLAGKHLGKKITVRGEVSRVDVSNPKHCYVWMKPGIVFDFLEFKAAAQDCKVGEMVSIDGILKRHAERDIMVAPAFKRDPKAPFKATKP